MHEKFWKFAPYARISFKLMRELCMQVIDSPYGEFSLYARTYSRVRRGLGIVVVYNATRSILH